MGLRLPNLPTQQIRTRELLSDGARDRSINTEASGV